MKRVVLLITGVTLVVCGYSQASGQAEKQVQDGERKANAAKADAIVARKKDIFDSTTFNANSVNAGGSKTVKARTKKKLRVYKTKHQSRPYPGKKKVE